MRAKAILTGLLVTAVLFTAHAVRGEEKKKMSMDLGQFSVSLTVKDLAASRAFYEKLGFEVYRHWPKGTPPGYEKSWVILQLQGGATIGLFHGMFDKNTLTFNPLDVRSVQRELKARGMAFTVEADEKTQGPAFVMLTDPDGNPVLLDQH